MKNYKETKTWGIHKLWKLALSIIVLLLFGLVTNDYENQVAFTILTLFAFWIVFYFTVQKRFRKRVSMTDIFVYVAVPLIYLFISK